MNSGYSTDSKVRDLIIDNGPPLRNDGPTLEEYLAAGYTAAGYPPSGWAEKPSDGLTLYRTTGQLPVTHTLAASEPVLDLPPAAAEVPAGDVPVAEVPPAAVEAVPEPVAEPEPAVEQSGRRRR